MSVRIVRETPTMTTFVIHDEDYVAPEEWPYIDIDRDTTERYLVIIDAAFPGYNWRVSVRHYHGIAQVSLPQFTDWSNVVHLQDLKGDPRLKPLLEAAGEFLERYRLPRSKADMDAVDSAIVKYMPALTYRLRPPE